MNAVAATTNFDPGILAAVNSSSAPAPAQGGFGNLINALLGPQEQTPVDDTPVPGDAQTSASESVNVRSSAEIADALIRSMLGSAVTATNVFSDRATTEGALAEPKTRTSKDSEPAQDAQATAVQSLAAPLIVPAIAPAAPVIPIANVQAPIIANGSPTLPSSLQSGSTKFKNNSSGSTAVLVPDAKPVASKAELAFALRLTPVDVPEASSAPPAPVQETGPSAPAAPVQTQIVPSVETLPAPPEPRSQAKDNPTANPLTTTPDPKQHQAPDREAVPAVAAVALAGDRSDDFARPLPNPVPVAVVSHNTEQTQAEPIRSAEQALRTSDVSAPTISAVRSPAQQIAVRIGGSESPAVDLQVTERAGQVHVSVRTADTGMQTSLRQDLGTLVNSLERSGYRAEAFTGHDTSSLTTVAAQTGGASNMDARNNDQETGQNNRGAQQDGSRQEGSRGQSNHSGGGQQQQRRQASNWIDTLEKAQ